MKNIIDLLNESSSSKKQTSLNATNAIEDWAQAYFMKYGKNADDDPSAGHDEYSKTKWTPSKIFDRIADHADVDSVCNALITLATAVSADKRNSAKALKVLGALADSIDSLRTMDIMGIAYELVGQDDEKFVEAFPEYDEK